MKGCAIFLVVAVVSFGWSAAQDAGDCATWYETTRHGSIFRNVKEFGAKGDGVTDDTAAIKLALTQDRSEEYQVGTPAIVYFPPGTYVITDTLPHYFNTYMIGNHKCTPTLLLPANSPGWDTGRKYLLSAQTLQDDSHTNNFYHGLAHFIITIGAGNAGGAGIHWSVSQASYIRDVVVNVGDGDVGIAIDNGSPTFLGDIVINGGNYGMSVGSQQYAMRNIKITGSRTACYQVIWAWEYLLQGMQFSNCPIGVQFPNSGQLVLMDSSFTNTPTAIQTTEASSLLLERVSLSGVTTVAPGLSGAGTSKISAWAQGIVFDQQKRLDGVHHELQLTRGDAPLPVKSRPTFDGASFINALDAGAKGDGTTDDTAALQAAIRDHDVVFLPFGKYLISDTLELRATSALVGEGFTVLVAKSEVAKWSDPDQPSPMIYVPNNAAATTMLADFMVTTQGDLPGVSLVQWGAGAGSGIWEFMYRTEHTVWGQLHLTGPGGGYLESIWGWVADHDINTLQTVTVNSPRGLLCESSGPTVMFGTAFEHSSEFQYRLDNCKNMVLILTQTETPYWQNPPTAWGMDVTHSDLISIYGTGLYNWYFGNQQSIFRVQNSTNVNLYAINTYHSVNTLDGDVNIPATSVSKSFTDNFMAYVNAWPASSTADAAAGMPTPTVSGQVVPDNGGGSTSQNIFARIRGNKPLLIGLSAGGAAIAATVLTIIAVFVRRRIRRSRRSGSRTSVGEPVATITTKSRTTTTTATAPKI